MENIDILSLTAAFTTMLFITLNIKFNWVPGLNNSVSGEKPKEGDKDTSLYIAGGITLVLFVALMDFIYAGYGYEIMSWFRGSSRRSMPR